MNNCLENGVAEYAATVGVFPHSSRMFDGKMHGRKTYLIWFSRKIRIFARRFALRGRRDGPLTQLDRVTVF